MLQSTHVKTTGDTARRVGVYGAAFAAPGLAIAATGALTAAALPAALLLGIFLVAVLAYVSSAVGLVERRGQGTPALRATVTAAPGAC